MQLFLLGAAKHKNRFFIYRLCLSCVVSRLVLKGSSKKRIATWLVLSGEGEKAWKKEGVPSVPTKSPIIYRQPAARSFVVCVV